MDFNKPTQKKIDRQKEREAEAAKLKKQQEEILSEVSKNKEAQDKKDNAMRAKPSAEVSKPKVVQRLVRRVFVDERKKQGWRVVKDDVRDEHKRTLGVKTFNELVLMEKSN